MTDHDAATRRFDVIIAGAGPTGQAMALALATLLEDDIAIAIVDRSPQAPDVTASNAGDPRAWALSAASVRFLEALGIWPDVALEAEPVTEIDITDSSLEAGVRPILLHYDNITEDGEPAAWICPNNVLLTALETARRTRPPGVITPIRGLSITALAKAAAGRRLILADGTILEADLIIGADGRHSTVRRLAGIKTVRFDPDQRAIVTTVALERPHGGKAVQHFLPGGPFAILPLPGSRACITWSEDRAAAEALLAADEDEFADAVQRRFGGRLGRVTIEGPRASFPLPTEMTRLFIVPGVALVGDAAHAVHPIAGQGLNLAFRDCAALAECLADCAGQGLPFDNPSALDRYQRWRRFDSTLSAAAFETLNRVFSNDIALVRSAREVGLGLVDRSNTLKQAFIKEAAGLSGDLPLLMR